MPPRVEQRLPSGAQRAGAGTEEEKALPLASQRNKKESRAFRRRIRTQEGDRQVRSRVWVRLSSVWGQVGLPAQSRADSGVTGSQQGLDLTDLEDVVMKFLSFGKTVILITALFLEQISQGQGQNYRLFLEVTTRGDGAISEELRLL